MPESNFSLHGVIPPVVTPLTREGEVDVASLRRLVDFEIEAGVDALFALGTGGEGPYLTGRSRDVVLRTVVEQAGGRVPVLAGVSDVGTLRSLEHVAAAERAGANAVVSTPPFYGEVSQAEIAEHYRRLHDVTELPVIAYDIPSKVHAKLAPETTAALAHSGVIAAVKDSSGDEDGFRSVIELTADVSGFSVITGSDVIADAAFLQGARGMIVGMGNIDPHGFVRLYDACKAGEWSRAHAEQTRLRALRRITQVAGTRASSFSATIASFKSAMVIRNIIANDDVQPPLLPLTDDERKQVATILEAADLAAAFDTPPAAASAA